MPMISAFGAAQLDPSLYIPELKVRRKPAVLEELVRIAAHAGVVREPEVLCASLGVRERLFGTGIGKGVAVPHLRSIAVIEPRLVIARSRRGLAWGASDGAAVQLVLLVLSPAEAGEERPGCEDERAEDDQPLVPEPPAEAGEPEHDRHLDR